MITNQFFRNFDADNEQRLLDSLIQESIKIHGLDAIYVARTIQNLDPIYETDDQSVYEQTFLIEMYLENVFGFQGDREFMSKFAGLEIRDQVVFQISRDRFTDEIGEELGTVRPREGDLIYFPLNKKCFQIKYVDQYDMFYPLGAIYTWKMTCELFEYSNEVFNTGIAAIDALQKEASFNILDYTLNDTDGIPLKTVEGDYIVLEKYDLDKIVPLADNIDIQTEHEANGYINWDESNPFGNEKGQKII